MLMALAGASLKEECAAGSSGTGNGKGSCSTIFFIHVEEVQAKLPAFVHLHHLRELSARKRLAVNDKRHRVLSAGVGNAPPQCVIKR